MERTKILYIPESSGMVEQNNICFWHRCCTPGEELMRLGYTVSFEEDPDFDRAKQFDVIVFNRTWAPKTVKLIEKLKKAEKTVIYDIDDNFWEIPLGNASYGYYSNPELLDTVDKSLRLADIVTTTTLPLVKFLKNFNNNIILLPNMLADKYWDVLNPVTQPLANKEIIIGWAGSNTHLPDLMILQGIVEGILDYFPEVKFSFTGMAELPFQKNDRIITPVPVPIEAYSSLLQTFHIGIAPLVDSVFNSSKSDLKFLEYAAVGVPVVASRTISYRNSIKNNESGLLARDKTDWVKYLARLIQKQPLRQDMGEKAFNYAQTRKISNHINLWIDAYQLSKI